MSNVGFAFLVYRDKRKHSNATAESILKFAESYTYRQTSISPPLSLALLPWWRQSRGPLKKLVPSRPAG